MLLLIVFPFDLLLSAPKLFASMSKIKVLLQRLSPNPTTHLLLSFQTNIPNAAHQGSGSLKPTDRVQAFSTTGPDDSELLFPLPLSSVSHVPNAGHSQPMLTPASSPSFSHPEPISRLVPRSHSSFGGPTLKKQTGTYFSQHQLGLGKINKQLDPRQKHHSH